MCEQMAPTGGVERYVPLPEEDKACGRCAGSGLCARCQGEGSCQTCEGTGFKKKWRAA